MSKQNAPVVLLSEDEAPTADSKCSLLSETRFEENWSCLNQDYYSMSRFGEDANRTVEATFGVSEWIADMGKGSLSSRCNEVGTSVPRWYIRDLGELVDILRRGPDMEEYDGNYFKSLNHDLTANNLGHLIVRLKKKSFKYVEEDSEGTSKESKRKLTELLDFILSFTFWLGKGLCYRLRDGENNDALKKVTESNTLENDRLQKKIESITQKMNHLLDNNAVTEEELAKSLDTINQYERQNKFLEAVIQKYEAKISEHYEPEFQSLKESNEVYASEKEVLEERLRRLQNQMEYEMNVASCYFGNREKQNNLSKSVDLVESIMETMSNSQSREKRRHDDGNVVHVYRISNSDQPQRELPHLKPDQHFACKLENQSSCEDGIAREILREHAQQTSSDMTSENSYYHDKGDPIVANNGESEKILQDLVSVQEVLSSSTSRTGPDYRVASDVGPCPSHGIQNSMLLSKQLQNLCMPDASLVYKESGDASSVTGDRNRKTGKGEQAVLSSRICSCSLPGIQTSNGLPACLFQGVFLLPFLIVVDFLPAPFSFMCNANKDTGIRVPPVRRHWGNTGIRYFEHVKKPLIVSELEARDSYMCTYSPTTV